ncbi:MAG: polymer-forming cytoskeletal protein [Lachnospiraceae bacterium]|nr:polymer-forming cytoskeletal protein [Lachnospiraceae bacterium]
MQVEEVTIEPDLQLEAAAAEVEIPEVTIPEATMSEDMAAAEEEEEPAPIAFQTDEEEIPAETTETAAAPAAMPADNTEESSTMDTSILEENVKMSDVNDFDIEDGPATDESSVITQGMTIRGDVTSEGSLEVIGAIQGNIAIKGKLTISGTINGNSKAGEIFADSAKIMGEVNSTGPVKIGQASVILGNVTGTSAVIAGAVKGDIDVHGPVILDTSAIVMGDIKSKSVQINNGAVIEGHCSQCYADVSPTSFFQDLKEA